MWPGADLRPQPGKGPESIAFGMLPPKFFAHIREKFLELDRQRRIAGVTRTE